MSKPNPNLPIKPNLKPFTDSFMAKNQLIDSLTSHISLYHSRSLSPNPNPNPNPRSSILKWFSSLTVPQRQAHLTVVDSNFTLILLQMLGKIRKQGLGFFIILPDIPLTDPPHLPSLCYKKSHGLLSRVAELNETERWIFDSIRLFGSREGEKIEECSSSVKLLDSMTVSEDFVFSMDRFVEAMDRVSNGEFLRGEESDLGSDWVELDWLKAKGYYSTEAFVANRLEVALRLAWLNYNNGKKRGVKLKDKANAAGVAMNVFWRKKGCMDWWGNLDAATRRKLLAVVLGKAAKSLIFEILKGVNSALEDEMWLFSMEMGQQSRNKNIDTSETIPMFLADVEFGFGSKPLFISQKPSSLANTFNRLIMIQDISILILSCWRCEYDIEKIFFSGLCSVNSISDCILRNLRGFLMVISLDCTKFELLGDGNFKSVPSKTKEKVSTCGHRKKGRNRSVKKLTPIPKTGVDSFDEPAKDLECVVSHTEREDAMKANEMYCTAHEKGNFGETSMSTVEMEDAQGLSVGKGRTAAKKRRKGKNKRKKSNSSCSVEVKNSGSTCAKVSTAVLSQDEAGKFDGASNSYSSQSVSSNFLGLSSSPSSFANEPDIASQSIQEDHSVGSAEGSSYMVPNGCLLSNSRTENRSKLPGTSNFKLENEMLSVVTELQLASKVGSENINLRKSFHASENKVNSIPENTVRALDAMEKFSLIREKKHNYFGNGLLSSSECLSYEWPSVGPVYFPSIHSHLPAATDRLHLDVGHNWRNHIRQPFVPTIQQSRNPPPTEGGCKHIFPRPLPLSLDWPPMVRSACGLAPSVTCNYNSEFISWRQSAFQQSFASKGLSFNEKATDDERKYSGDLVDLPDLIADECESHWISEEELEMHAVSGIDYNQYFGGGVMYWNPSDHPGTGFSRPPSLSSDDSSWAWHEADMNRAVDDMVAFSSSYSTNGLASPTGAPFCSPFDSLGHGHQTLGYVVPGNELPGKVLHPSNPTTDAAAEEEVSGSLVSLSSDVEGKTGDSLPYPILRPIIIPNMSRERSRSDFMRGHDHKSPCVPPNKREQRRIKRPPSPVVLCVPRAPRHPPPSPVSGSSRKNKGFPTVRSGSSSPRHWGMRGWYPDGANLEEACIRMDGAEVVWPTWRNKNLSAHPLIQPLPGALLQDRLIAISQLAREQVQQEHPDVAFPLQPPDLQNSSTSGRATSQSLMHSLLHDEIDFFCKQVAAENMARKPFINWAVKRVTRSLQVLWPRSRANIFGSNATGLSLPTSDVDLVVCLPPVRNLEPIKEAGILEGRNGIKETCLQHAARYLANQEWVKNDSLKTVENTAIPIIMLVVEVPCDLITTATSNVLSPNGEQAHLTSEHVNHVQSALGGLEDFGSPKCSQIRYDDVKDVKSVRLDISFKSPSHTGLQTTKLVKELTEQFPAATPLALVLKQFLADRSLDQSYSGCLSSYCLVLLITRFLQHEHHLGRPINQNFGSLLMDFLYFFGNVFDPRQMRISVQGSGVYINRERGYSIDPLHIDDPLFPTNNVGRNCFRIHQCIKAFSEAYSMLESELLCLTNNDDSCLRPPYRLLPKIIPSINL